MYILYVAYKHKNKTETGCLQEAHFEKQPKYPKWLNSDLFFFLRTFTEESSSF